MLENQILKKKKVLVGVSGGIDSSACLLILKKKGFNITGVYFKTGNLKDKENIARLKKIFLILKLKFFVKNITDEFKKRVVDRFIFDYQKNKTPNPCVFCNKKIKFNFLIKEAKRLGINLVATGHYAKIK